MDRSTVKDRSERRVALATRLAGWIGLALLTLPAHAQNDVLGQMDRQVTEMVARVKPAVVSVRVSRQGSRQKPAPRVYGILNNARVGTGFVVDRDGTILTTADVVGNADQVTVRLWDGRELGGKVLGSDPPTGVAVVKVAGGDLPALRLAGEARPAPGQWTIIVGNELDMAESVWVGTIARTDVVLAVPQPLIEDFPGGPGQKVAMQRLEMRLSAPLPAGKLLQIDAPVGPGASGAPVLDSRGAVIGVVVATSNPRRQARAVSPDPREDTAPGVREKLKESPDWQRQVRQIAAEAQRISQRAAEHARVLSEQISAKAKQLAEQATERSKALRERFEAEKRQAEEDRSKSEAERQRLEAEQARQMERELQPLMRDLQRQLDQELKPLEEELKRQLDSDLKPLQEQLKKLNEMLPMLQGMREITVDLAPQIATAVAQAHEEAQAALAAALKACETAAPPAAPAPAAPAVPPAAPAPAAPGPGPAAPSAAPPALRAPPLPAAAAAAPIPAAAPLPPAVRFWAGRSPGNGACTYAIPAATAAWAASQIREHGHVAHPFMGLQLQELKPEDRQRLSAPEEARVRVTAVAADSPAREAGLQQDDVILEFQGKQVEGPADLMEQVARARVGERVSLLVWRDGKRLTLYPTLKEQPAPRWLFRGPTVILPALPFIVTQPRLPALPFIVTQPRVIMPNGPLPRVMRLSPLGHVAATASGTGRRARVTLEAQDADLAAVLRELSRATGLHFTAEGAAARQLVTLKVERVRVDDLVESLERLYHLRGERQGDTITFRTR